LKTIMGWAQEAGKDTGMAEPFLLQIQTKFVPS
jgi:hypothetical protein